MNRRAFLRAAGLVPASFGFPSAGRLFAQGARLGGWRTFEMTTRVEVLKPSGATRLWVPAALITTTPYQKTLANTFKCEGGTAKTFESKPDGLGIVAAEFPAGVRPSLTITSRVATRN